MPQTPLPEWSARDEPWREIAGQINRMVRQVNTDAALLAGRGLTATRLAGTGAALAAARGDCPPGLRMLVVRITAAEAGAGKYAGHIFSPNCTAQASTALFMPEGMLDSANNNALILNLAENGLALPNRLLEGSYHVGVHVGVTSESTPRAIVLVADPGPVLFPVQVTQDGGSDGTASYPASWTYAVFVLDRSVTLGTQVPLARPRPVGSMIYQTGEPAFGLAFVDAAGALRLWDAGEVPAA